jgi:hypothetical protein
LPVSLGDVWDSRRFLTDDGWIVFSFSMDGFFNYFEEMYFKPGTEKNAEFEVMFGPIKTSSGMENAGWVRIRDTPKNRVNLKKALEKFYSIKLEPEWEDFIEYTKREILRNLDLWYPMRKTDLQR